MERTFALSALASIALLVATPALAATTSYTMNWSTSVASGYTIDGVKVTTKMLGGTSLYSSPSGPWIGSGAANDLDIVFDKPVKEFCAYVWWNNTGEATTITTNQTSGNVYRGIDTGAVVTTVTGNTFTWSAMASSNIAAMCVANDKGISSIHYDHNGVGSGLVFGDKVLLASAACTPQTWYLDGDKDGHGWAASSTSACAAPAGYVASSDDCDDGRKETYPGATEYCNGEDDNCDKVVDEDDSVDAPTWYADTDKDTYGNPAVSKPACSVPDGYVSNAGDCDDTETSVYPGATEVAYDGVDQDCDGEDLCDVDVDGYDHALCGGTDCDDDLDTINPGVTDAWYDGVDSDCDGWSDFDADYDGFDSGEFEGSDCDDDDPEIHPDADEVWYDEIDTDCDGESDLDADGDGYDSIDHGGEDCDDDAVDVFPGAVELIDGVDNDCDGVSEVDDLDGDGVADESELDLGLDPTSRDSDDDGVFDRDELVDGVAIDTDKDGVIDALDTDDDGDGVPTADERGTGKEPLDTDHDGVPDYLDTDSDGDGFSDADEGSVDSDYDGVPDRVDLDSDEDGVADADEFDGDTDEDGLDDRLDMDDDDDGFSTFEEQLWDSADLDGDGVDNYLDDDSDGDGTPDASEGWGDEDCDDVPNVQDADDADGPCMNVPGAGFQSGSCSGASTTGLPAGGMALVMFGLLGLVRRRWVR
ncbi:MAG: MYXO-CTERM domain-containing protein [Kiritimatiellia bacterium]|jgi:MYXO-CTERM domain-containing protein